MNWLELASAVFVGVTGSSVASALALSYLSGRGRRKQMKQLHEMLQQRISVKAKAQKEQGEPAAAD